MLGGRDNLHAGNGRRSRTVQRGLQHQIEVVAGYEMVDSDPVGVAGDCRVRDRRVPQPGEQIQVRIHAAAGAAADARRIG